MCHEESEEKTESFQGLRKDVTMKDMYGYYWLYADEHLSRSASPNAIRC